jgi:hypothetical protein
VRKSLALVASLLLALALLVVGTGTANASLHTVQFTLHSAPGAQVSIPDPPLPLTHVTVQENLLDAANNPAGSAHIDCRVLAPNPTPPLLVLACTADFTLLTGTIHGYAAFVTNMHDYPALVTSGTGAYQGATGTVRVQDTAPGNEIYTFNLVLL